MIYAFGVESFLQLSASLSKFDLLQVLKMVVFSLFIVCWINFLGLIYFLPSDLWPDIGHRSLDYVRTYSGSQLHLLEDHNVSRPDVLEIVAEETALAVTPLTALTLPYSFKDDNSSAHLLDDHNVSRPDVLEIFAEETALAVAPPAALTLPYSFKDDNSSALILCTLVMLSVPATLLLYKVYRLFCRTFKKLRAEDSPDSKHDKDFADEVSFRSPMMTALPDEDSRNKTDAVEVSKDDDLPPANHSPSEDEKGSETDDKPKMKDFMDNTGDLEIVKRQDMKKEENETAAETSQSDVVDSWEELLEDNPDKELLESDVVDSWEELLEDNPDKELLEDNPDKELLEDSPDKEEENGHGENAKMAKKGRTKTRKRNGLLYEDDDDDDNYDDEYDYCYDYGKNKSTRLLNRSSVKAKKKKDEKQEERKVPVKKYKTKKVKDEMAVPEVIGMDLSLPGILKGSKSRSRQERRVTFESPLAFYKTERTEDEIDVHFEVQRVKFKSWELRQQGLQQKRK